MTNSNLTKRQIDILLGLAEGMTNGEIAADLWIAEQTVKFHMSALLEAMDAKNRTHAVALAYHRGILVPCVRETDDK